MADTKSASSPFVDPVAQQPYVDNGNGAGANQHEHVKEAHDMERASNGEWSHSFWDCFSPGDLCFKSCCCPCFVFGKTQIRLEDPSLQSYSSVNGPCAIYLGLQYIGGCGFIYQMIKRGEMRRAYGIKGDGFTDCLASCCCHCCTLMQMDKEVVSRQAGNAQPPFQGQGYVAPQGMNPVPQ